MWVGCGGGVFQNRLNSKIKSKVVKGTRRNQFRKTTEGRYMDSIIPFFSVQLDSLII